MIPPLDLIKKSIAEDGGICICHMSHYRRLLQKPARIEQILPAVESYAAKLAETLATKKALSPLLGGKYETSLLTKLSGLTDDIAEAADALEASLVAYHKIGDVTEAACFIRDEVLPKMDALRAPADEAERFTAAEYWPFPTYGDLLFGVK